ncbi:cardioactive peptide [Condylostylus longicornis]|uniref:cardioactive peptide n=1 Tax=Condylostylus longicornis TaxID=2530218 RepID=UPI00244DF04D|nr:cardioactive peptide [Condylostylus longicornis]XP_055387639.1 cardioactive peptide [Condylostylus longicornis]
MLVYGVWFYIITIYLNLYGLVDCGIITPREMDIRRINNMEIRKRPFCNAFTGCGKKRSAIPYNLHELNGNSLNNNVQNNPNSNNNNNQNQNGQPEELDSSLTDLIDLNAEPAVEDLMRQIMSQAKLWEAIQEASREIQLQRHHNDRGSEQPRFPNFNAQ